MKLGKRSKRAANDVANWSAYVQWVQQQAENQKQNKQVQQGGSN